MVSLRLHLERFFVSLCKCGSQLGDRDRPHMGRRLQCSGGRNSQEHRVGRLDDGILDDVWRVVVLSTIQDWRVDVVSSPETQLLTRIHFECVNGVTSFYAFVRNCWL